jgi:AcrR family transcriptional regulator
MSTTPKKTAGCTQPDTMNGFARRKEHSKEEIRKAAFDLFSQFGVDRVSMVDIARKAGVSQATIYNNFGSKEALAREFVTTSVDQLIDRIEAILTPDKRYTEKMDAFMAFIGDMLAHTTSLAAENPVFTSKLDLHNDPEIKEIRDAAQKKMTNLLLRVIREGKAQGHIDPALSETACGIYFQAFMDIFTAPQLQHRFQKDPDLVLSLGTLLMYGLSGQPE